MKRYKIVAYGPGKKCLTWADETNLEAIKRRLRKEGDRRAEYQVEEDDDMRFCRPHPRNPLVDGWICPYC